MIVDLFSGPGGWDEGLRQIGRSDVVGLEWEKWACATAEAAGHARRQCDVSTVDPAEYAGAEGLIASPPCQAWSSAGKRLGEDDRPACHELAERMAAGDDSLGWHKWADPRSSLVAQPVRWVRELRPEWIALEEVPAVLGLWEHFAGLFERMGYHAWTGVLNSANYGIISPCHLHAINPQRIDAECVGPLSQYVTALAYAMGPAMTPSVVDGASLAAIVAGRLARAIRPAFAGLATCDERERALAALAASVGPTIPVGSEAATWTIEATSRFGLTLDTVASIGSLLSSYLGDRLPEGKWSTTSTEIRRIIVHRISKSIAATLITGCNTGGIPQARSAGCGLCVDVAVPQTRKRAILIASRVGRVAPPMPTHSRGGDMFTEPWVSMAEALGWDDGPAQVVTEKTRSWTYVNGNQAHAARVPADEPAPTVHFAQRMNDVRWAFMAGGIAGEGRAKDPATQPADTLTGKGAAAWAYERPATSVMGDPRIAPPGHRDRSSDGPVMFAEGSVRVSVQEAAVLQSFPVDYPWQGSRTKQFLQVGNAIPPLLAAHVLTAVGAARQEAAA